MKKGVNEVTLVGNIGKDPEVRHQPSGDPVASFSVATNNTWKDKQSGELKEATEWHRCVAFGQNADFVSKYLGKGSEVYIRGSLKTDSYQHKQYSDVTMYSTSVKVRELLSIGGKSESNVTSHNQSGGTTAGTINDIKVTNGDAGDAFNDEIPF